MILIHIIDITSAMTNSQKTMRKKQPMQFMLPSNSSSMILEKPSRIQPSRPPPVNRMPMTEMTPMIANISILFSVLLLAKVAIHTITCKFIVFHLRFLSSMHVSSDFIWFHFVFMMGGEGLFGVRKEPFSIKIVIFARKINLTEKYD